MASAASTSSARGTSGAVLLDGAATQHETRGDGETATAPTGTATATGAGMGMGTRNQSRPSFGKLYLSLGNDCRAAPAHGGVLSTWYLGELTASQIAKGCAGKTGDPCAGGFRHPGVRLDEKVLLLDADRHGHDVLIRQSSRASRPSGSGPHTRIPTNEPAQRATVTRLSPEGANMCDAPPGAGFRHRCGVIHGGLGRLFARGIHEHRPARRGTGNRRRADTSSTPRSRRIPTAPGAGVPPGDYLCRSPSFPRALRG
jgi:hypothetical protein